MNKFPSQFAILHKPTGKFFGGDGIYYWGLGGMSRSDSKNAKHDRVKLYRTKGTAMSVAKQWNNGPETDLEVVEFGLTRKAGHQVA